MELCHIVHLSLGGILCFLGAVTASSHGAVTAGATAGGEGLALFFSQDSSKDDPEEGGNYEDQDDPRRNIHRCFSFLFCKTTFREQDLRNVVLLII